MDLSPSVNHRFLLQELRPALSYPGPDPRSWRSDLRAKLVELLGLPQRDGSPLNVRTLWQQEHELGAIARIVFTAERRADVPAYFCTPRDVAPPYRVAICLQGHTSGMHNSIARAYDDESRAIDVPGDRDFALSAMRNGYAALCLEQRSFGYRGETEQHQVSEHGCHDAAMQALMLGRTILGERVFDVDRALDYLADRGDIDMSGVGVLGNSGGGTVGIYSAALLDRIGFAMPGCSLATFAGSIMSIYHCADNYVPRLAQWADAGDILGLFAPRPVVVVAGRDDPIFPIAAVEEAFATVQRIYDDHDAGDRCSLVIGAGGHRFYADEGWDRLRSINP